MRIIDITPYGINQAQMTQQNYLAAQQALWNALAQNARAAMENDRYNLSALNALRAAEARQQLDELNALLNIAQLKSRLEEQNKLYNLEEQRLKYLMGENANRNNNQRLDSFIRLMQLFRGMPNVDSDFIENVMQSYDVGNIDIPDYLFNPKLSATDLENIYSLSERNVPVSIMEQLYGNIPGWSSIKESILSRRASLYDTISNIKKSKEISDILDEINKTDESNTLKIKSLTESLLRIAPEYSTLIQSSINKPLETLKDKDLVKGVKSWAEDFVQRHFREFEGLKTPEVQRYLQTVIPTYIEEEVETYKKSRMPQKSTVTSRRIYHDPQENMIVVQVTRKEEETELAPQLKDLLSKYKGAKVKYITPEGVKIFIPNKRD